MKRWLEPVRAALDRAAEPVPIFFRDDDAGWRDDRLHAVLDLFARRGLPVDLGVIPAALTSHLAAQLELRKASETIGLHQHGLAHANHEPAGRSCEFGPSRSRAAQLRDLDAGRRRLAELLGPLVQPLFTPPWNRCTQTTGECLRELGFEALSRELRAEPLALAGLTELPVDVDWFAKRKGLRLNREAIGLRVAAALAAPGPVGIMLHHAAMDADERADLDALLALVAAHPAAAPRPMAELLEAVAA